MVSIVNDPAQAELLEKWRRRHANPDAVSMWAIATTLEARAYAFTAIAQDPQILQRADRRQAVRMAVQAEEFALSIEESGDVKSPTWQAMALFVRRSIDDWRQLLRGISRRGDGMGQSSRPAIMRPVSQDPWEIARRNFPHVDDETGRLTTRILREFGAAVLGRVRKPWDHLIAVGVLRYTARLLRGELPAHEPGASSERGVADVLAIQTYAEKVRLSPLLVPYSGPGKPAQQALSLTRDARTLRDAVRAAMAGGESRASVWQQAIDLHAFALVALDHRILLDLPLEEAYQLAAAAVRQADTALRTPDVVDMPLLPPGSQFAPEVVGLHAMACLPPGDPARNLSWREP